MLTTKILGFTESEVPKSKGINWCGQPIKDGEDYYGRIDTADIDQDAPQTSVDGPRTRRKRQAGRWTPERRKAFGDRVKAYWAAKRAGTTDSKSVAAFPASPSVWDAASKSD